MRRRDVLSLIGGAAVSWPVGVRAQHQHPPRRIGMLIGYAENDPEIQARLGAFRQALEGNGWKEGRSLHIDYRFAPASPNQAQVFAKELVALQPDALVGDSTPATAALLTETRTIPIVFVDVYARPCEPRFGRSGASCGRSVRAQSRPNIAIVQPLPD